MAREDLNALLAFLAIAQERSFTRAAAQLGVSQSALSHTVRGLETRLGLRLLTRTTRSVSPTEAGERLMRTLGPRFAEIDAELLALRELHDKPAGTIRITAAGHAANTVLWPKLSTVLPDYPDIQVEISEDYGLTDIVAQGFDAGVRLGELVEKGHDRRAHRTGPAHGRGGHARLLRTAPGATHPAGSGDAQLHQPAAAHPWRAAGLGVRARWSCLEGPRAGSVGVQQEHADAACSADRCRPGLPARRPGAGPSRGGPTATCSGGLVPGLRRLPPLLCEPPAILTSPGCDRRGAAVSGLSFAPGQHGQRASGAQKNGHRAVALPPRRTEPALLFRCFKPLSCRRTVRPRSSL
uniref:HTH lysR-type domain-containing protein n=1 Tax=mine drainage metagenome TaxID=410659 RepID=E6PSK5_9ZZZZ